VIHGKLVAVIGHMHPRQVGGKRFAVISGRITVVLAMILPPSLSKKARRLLKVAEGFAFALRWRRVFAKRASMNA